MIRRQKLIGIIASVLLAAVGTGLLVAYVRSAENRALKGEETVEVLVVSNTIPKGTKAEDITASLRLAQVPVEARHHGALAEHEPAGRQGGRRRPPARRAAGEHPLHDGGRGPGHRRRHASGDHRPRPGPGARRAAPQGRLRRRHGLVHDPETTHLILHKVKVTDVRTTDGVAVGSPATGPAPAAALLVTLALDAPCGGEGRVRGRARPAVAGLGAQGGQRVRHQGPDQGGSQPLMTPCHPEKGPAR